MLLLRHIQKALVPKWPSKGKDRGKDKGKVKGNGKVKGLGSPA